MVMALEITAAVAVVGCSGLLDALAVVAGGVDLGGAVMQVAWVMVAIFTQII